MSKCGGKETSHEYVKFKLVKGHLEHSQVRR